MRKLIVLGTLFIISCGGGSAKKAVQPDGSVLTPTDTSVLSPPPSTVLACSQAAPSVCGGNIVGTWKGIGFCDPGKTQADVIAAYEKYSQCGTSADMKENGYMKFRADGTWQAYEEDIFIVNYPESCLKNTTVPCSKIGVDCCVSDGVTCTCNFVPPHGVSAGYYTADNSQYRLIDYTGERLDRSYCVQGDILSIFAPSDSVFGGGTVVLSRVPDSDIPDVDAGPLPGVKYDASVDVFVDSAVGQDAASDKPKADAGIPDASLEAPRPDTAADKPKDNAPVIDAMPVDTQPINATPVPYALMPPSMPAVCQMIAPAPCGGDLSGSWNIIGSCDQWMSETEFLSQLDKDCATAADKNETGTIVFSANGICSVDEKPAYQADYAVSCLASQQSDTCTAKDQRIRKEVGTNYVSDASCELTSSETCRCVNTFDAPAAADACTYTVNGEGLTFVSPPATFSAKTYNYCAQGNTLTIFYGSASAAGQACASCYAGLVLVRTN